MKRLGPYRILRSFFGMVAILLVTSPSGSAVEERDLTLGRRPSALLMTEDGKHLIANDSNKSLRVIDPVEFKELSAIEVAATGPMLSRVGKLYVGEQETGLVKIYSEATWELVNEVDTGVRPLITLSAKTGKSFDGMLLASSHSLVHLVDIAKDRHRAVGQGNLKAQFSPDGRHVIHVADRKFVAFTEADYLNGKTDRPVVSCDVSSVQSPVPYVDEFWVGGGGVYVGLVPSSHMDRLGHIVLPDPSPETRLIYAVSEKKIEVRRLDPACSLLETIVLKESINTHSGSQPCVRRNADGSVTLFWVPYRILGISSVTFKVTSPIRSNEVGTQEIKLPVADENQLVTGPVGTSISNGILLWKPPVNPEPGEYTFKVKQTNAGTVSFFRESIKVLPAEASVSDEVIRLELAPGSYTNIKAHVSSREIAILDDMRLLLFDTSGRLERTIPLAKPYHDVAVISGGFALCSKDEIEVLDTSGKILKTIGMGAVEVSQLASAADGQSLYASCKDPREQELAKSLPVFRIDLQSHQAKRLERAAGSGLVVNRSGDQLLTFVSHSKLHNVGLLDYVEENTDVVMNYQVVGEDVRMHHANAGVGSGIQGLSCSADGAHIALHARGILSQGGMSYGRRVPIFSASNLEKPERIITLNSGGIRDLCYHPKLDQLYVLYFSKTGSEVVSGVSVYGADGNELKSMLPEGLAIPADPDQIIFAPDGTSLMVSGRDLYGRKILKRFDLQLSADEKSLCAKPAPTPKSVFSQSIPGSDLGQSATPGLGGGGKADGLTPTQFKELLTDQMTRQVLSPELMGVFQMPSVVIVNSGDGGIGAGFFVSTDGHILTAAHCLPALGGPMVSHYMALPFGRLEFETPAIVIDVDQEKDLALIKIDFNAPTVNLQLGSRDPVVGSKVYAIGHPGIENLSLNYTLTEGLVSSQVRKIDGRSLLQISAAVNPGNSGGPVLDDRGCVIGMVSQKALLEGASFAVPGDMITEFISKSLAASDRPEPDRAPLIKEIREKAWVTIDQLRYTGDSLQGKQRALAKGDPSKWFTGTMVMLANPPDHVFFTSEYKDGYAHGNTIVFDRRKRRVSLREYRMGELEGQVINYHPSGNLRNSQGVQGGKAHGYFREYYDQPMAVKEAVHFSNGVRSGPVYLMDELGRVVASAFLREGKVLTQSEYTHYNQVAGIPIIEYTKAGDLAMVQELVKKGASLNELHNERAPIHVAAEIKYIYMVQGLIELGGKVDAKNGDGKTALELVMSQSDPAIPVARALIANGADKSVLTDSQRAKLEE